jgi:hypothetical protein
MNINVTFDGSDYKFVDFEVERIAKNLRQGVEVADRWKGLRRYKQCFLGNIFSALCRLHASGSDAVNWLVENSPSIKGQPSPRIAAASLCSIMLRLGLMHETSEESTFEDGPRFYRFQEDKSDIALNCRKVARGTISAEPLSLVLTILDTLLLMFAQAQRELDCLSYGLESVSTCVKRIRESDTFDVFENAAAQLQLVALCPLK